MKTVKKAPLRKTISRNKKVTNIPITRVEGEQAFWVNFGPILHSLDELSSALKTMNEDTFRHHVSANRNDFARWIEEVMHDKSLAKKLQACDSKTCCINAVGRHLRVHY
jgi:hypothetical protein